MRDRGQDVKTLRPLVYANAMGKRSKAWMELFGRQTASAVGSMPFDNHDVTLVRCGRDRCVQTLSGRCP